MDARDPVWFLSREDVLEAARTADEGNAWDAEIFGYAARGALARVKWTEQMWEDFGKRFSRGLDEFAFDTLGYVMDQYACDLAASAVGAFFQANSPGPNRFKSRDPNGVLP